MLSMKIDGNAVKVIPGDNGEFRVKLSGDFLDITETLTDKQRQKVIDKIASANSSEFYLLGFWNNAYSRGTDKEYFWAGPFDTRQEALAFGKRKLENGQPSRFYDWSGGGKSVFSDKEKFIKAANKAGINPRFEE